jgi:hypothetical protein
MKALLITLNGKRICLAGSTDHDAVWADIQLWNDPKFGKDELSSWGKGDKDFSMWAQEQLAIGDEIVICVVDADVADEPVKRTPVQRKDSISN